jgi:predicted HAD superfamily Cof-like phosphohydrolase
MIMMLTNTPRFGRLSLTTYVVHYTKEKDMKQVEFTIKTIMRKEKDPQEFAETLQLSLRNVLDMDGTVRLSDSEAVKAFQDKFNIPMPASPQFPSPEVFEFRMKFLTEEVLEFIDAYVDRDLHAMADALIDLVYVAHGTALMMGLPWSPLWEEVQRANITKIRATHAGESKRGSALDVIKPIGWVGPNFDLILGPKT